MKPLSFIVLLCLATFAGSGQYYYNDLIAARDIMKKRELYQQQEVKSVQYSAYSGSNQPIEDFKCRQNVRKNFTEIVTSTSSPVTGTSENISYFNNEGQLLKTVDTTDGNKITITYTYIPGNLISNIDNEAVSAGNYTNHEQHQWFYNDKGQPVKMWKIKNQADTTYVTFTLDEKGNIAEENSIHKGQQQPTFYYYYNDANQLTDIVRWNSRVKKLLPDYIFEYNRQQNYATMIVVPEGSNEYQKWYYTYNERGLKIKDECYSRDRRLIGKIEYQYQY